MLLEDPRAQVLSYNDALRYWKKLLFLVGMSQGVFPCHSLTQKQYATLAYKSWSSKGTIKNLRTNVSILNRGTKANSSKQKKDVEVGSLKKVKGKKGKAPIEDSDAKEQKSYDDAYESQGFALLIESGTCGRQ